MLMAAAYLYAPHISPLLFRIVIDYTDDVPPRITPLAQLTQYHRPGIPRADYHGPHGPSSAVPGITLTLHPSQEPVKEPHAERPKKHQHERHNIIAPEHPYPAYLVHNDIQRSSNKYRSKYIHALRYARVFPKTRIQPENSKHDHRKHNSRHYLPLKRLKEMHRYLTEAELEPYEHRHKLSHSDHTDIHHQQKRHPQSHSPAELDIQFFIVCGIHGGGTFGS